jgi:glycosyltransferase involved in cell wall biosynthesis
MARIGFDAKRMFFNRSGLGNYGRNILRLLHTFFSEHEYYLYTPPLKNVFWSVDYPSVKIVTPDRLVDRLLPGFWRAGSMTKQIARDGCAIFHGLNNELPRNIHKTKTRTVMTVHDLIFLRFPQYYQAIDRVVYTWKSRYSVGITDMIIADSIQTKQDLVTFFGVNPDKVRVVYLSCNPMYYKIVSPETITITQKKYNLPTEYLLMVGTIEERKNLLGVVKSLYSNKIDHPLVVVGKQTPYYHTVKDYIGKHALGRQIIFQHGVATGDLPALYQGARAVLYPSFFEGFGFPILEGLYSKVPVITSKEGCFSEVGGPASFYVDPHNTQEIGNAVKRVLSDTELRATMIARGYEHAQKFNEDVIASQIMNVYRTLV